MAHECLSLSGGASPRVVTSGTTLYAPQEQFVFLPAGTIYVGMAFRWRISGTIAVPSITGTPLLRPVVAFFTTNPAVQTQPALTAIFVNPTNVNLAIAARAAFFVDFTMVCRAVATALTTFFPGGFFSSAVHVGANQNNHTVQTVIVSPPAISTGAVSCNNDLWLGFALFTQNPSTVVDYTMETVRVDQIA